jgi:phosphoglycolate phosphatase-like HAD superfamily hydrolase
MSAGRTILVLDADGVFLSERPYWNAALGAALDLAGLSPAVNGGWTALADAAFGPLGLQRMAKIRGCNSNWDLAAVLAKALEQDRCRGEVARLLADGRGEQAMAALARGGESVWTTTDQADPLLAAGIDRHGRFYTGVAQRFQEVLFGDAGLDWSFRRWRLRGDRERTDGAFRLLEQDGYDLRVCTGRHRAEIEAPIRELGLEGWLSPFAITSADDTDRAQRDSGFPSLGKPHWFPPACAVLGYQAALSVLRSGGEPGDGGSALYAGDALADFQAVLGCRELGINLGYIHVLSGVTTPEQDRAIAEAPGTLGVVDRFDRIPEVLA